MAALRDFLYWEAKIFVFLSLLPFLVMSDTASPSAFGENKIIDDHLTGHVQIRKHSVPADVLPCLTEPVSTEASDCPFKNSQWNDMHCQNDSFGMYTNQKTFVNFGAGPLGVVFPSLLSNPLGFSLGVSSGSSDLCDPYNTNQRIKALLKENAAASMNATLLGQMLHNLQREKENLKQELSNMKQTNTKQSGEIHTLKLQAERWKEGHQACKVSNVEQRNTSSIALRAAHNHIAHLNIENTLFKQINKEYLSDLTFVRKSLTNAQNESQEKELELSHCSIMLTSIQQSETAIRKALSAEEKEHNEDIDKCEADHNLLSSEKQDARVAYASCDASLKEITNVHEHMKQNYDASLEGAGRTNAQLVSCRGALNVCRGNHSSAANACEMCEQDRKLCRAEVSGLNESWEQCKKNVNVSYESLNSVNANAKELTTRYESIESELRDVRIKNKFLRNSVKTLRINLDEERQVCSDADATASTKLMDLAAMKTSFETARDRFGKVSKQLGELGDRYTNVMKDKYRLETELSVATEQLHFVKHSYKQCQGSLDDESVSSQRIAQTEYKCQKQLSNVTTSLAVIESQRNACFKRRHINVKLTDEWRQKYQVINQQLYARHLDHINCTDKLNLLNNRHNVLQKESDEIEALNENLNGRIKTTLEITSSTANSNTNLRKTMSFQQQKIIVLHQQLNEFEATLAAVKRKHTHCIDQYDESKDLVVSLKEGVSESKIASASLQERLDQCSGVQQEERAAHEAQSALCAETQQHLLSAENQLQTARSRMDGALGQADTLGHRLQLCRDNHTESLGQADLWQQQLTQCQEKGTADQLASIQRVSQVQHEHAGCQDNLRRTRESYNATLLANKQCNNEKKAERKRAEGLHVVSQTSHRTIIKSRRRVMTLNDVVDKLQSDKKMLQTRVDNLGRRNDNSRDLLSSCHEANDKKEKQLFEATGQLDDCHQKSLSVQPVRWGCPLTEQGTYVSKPSGCLLVTRSSGTRQQQVSLCREQAAGRLVQAAAAETPQLNTDLTALLYKIQPEADQVFWVDAPQGHSGDRCPVLYLEIAGDLPTTVTLERDCSEQLPALCIADVLGMTDMTGRTDFDTQVDTTSYFVNSETSHSFSTSSDGISSGSVDLGDWNIDSLLPARLNQSFLNNLVNSATSESFSSSSGDSNSGLVNLDDDLNFNVDDITDIAASDS